LVICRNPWGNNRKGIWEGAWSDGSKEWTKEAQDELNHKFGNDSVFWIEYKDLLRKYQHFDRTRLFRDPGWRCAQRWIGVEVPWKPQYNEKFDIKLTQDSPLVLVLTQLDTRYYKGLEGQYSFRLHFRVHEKGLPGAEDYIVRSHGNYLMDRSVSIELPDMPAGHYSIFISVTAQRDSFASAVEDIVKRECKSREENEKLAQVGAAFDLAHSKAQAHLQEVARLRKQKDQQKASESRRDERRRIWEKRHINRAVKKQQEQKNADKKARLAARQAAIKDQEALAQKARKPAEQQKLEVEAEIEQKVKKERQQKEKQAPKSEEPTPAEEKPTEATTDESKTEKIGDDVATNNTETEGQNKDATGVEDEEKKDDVKEGEKKTEKVSETTESLTTADAKNFEVSENAQDAKEIEVKDKNLDEQLAVVETPPDETKSADKSQDAVVEEKPETISCSSSVSSSCPQDTPKTEEASVVGSDEVKQEVPPADGGPPPPPSPKPKSVTPTPPLPVPKPKKERCTKRPINQKYDVDEGSSSDSPVEAWEDLYSSDDMSRRPGTNPPAQRLPKSETIYATDDEGLPDPWNAICIVGFRVYSQDEQMVLRVTMEGDELAEGGMGEKGEADLDDAQVNAGGERTEPTDDNGKNGYGFTPFPSVITNNGKELVVDDDDKGTDGDDETDDSDDGEDSKNTSDTPDYVKIDSGSSTPAMITPEPTPLESRKELC
jgi:hypothetical protein